MKRGILQMMLFCTFYSQPEALDVKETRGIYRMRRNGLVLREESNSVVVVSDQRSRFLRLVVSSGLFHATIVLVSFSWASLAQTSFASSPSLSSRCSRFINALFRTFFVASTLPRRDQVVRQVAVTVYIIRAKLMDCRWVTIFFEQAWELFGVTLSLAH